jgi:hypothetical protein
MAINVNLTAKDNGFSDIVLSNVEALSQTESSTCCNTYPMVLICLKINNVIVETGYNNCL